VHACNHVDDHDDSITEDERGEEENIENNPRYHSVQQSSTLSAKKREDIVKKAAER
jgi:hypothetical protein